MPRVSSDRKRKRPLTQEVARLRGLAKSPPRNSSENDRRPRPSAQTAPALTKAAAESGSYAQPWIREPTAYAADQEQASIWRGSYWSTTFGVGSGRTKINGQDADRHNCIGCSPPDNVFIANVNTQGAPYRATGAFADFSLGVNAPVGDRLVFGAQADGTIGEISFGSKGTRSYTFSDASGVIPPSPGLGSFDLRATSPWMLTGLLRGGFLVDQATLLYAVAGWTVAQFNIPSYAYNGRFDDFINSAGGVTMNGPTVGLGIERKIDKNWSILAEFRYTQFLASSLSRSSMFADAFMTDGSDVAQTKYNSDMYTANIRISYLIRIGW